MSSIAAYLADTAARVDRAIAGAALDEDHARLVQATVEAGRAQAQDPLDDPLSVVHLVARAHGRTMDEQAHAVGSFAYLYLLSLDLFDDVQDDDLEGGTHADAGAAVAINDAIALLFLALDELRQAMALETDSDRRLAYLHLFNRISLEAVAGQHRDLRGEAGARTPDEVLAMHQAKTSSMQLLVECGGLLGRVDADAMDLHRRVGASLAQFIQIRDDIRDVFGKPLSVDLRTGKMSHPLACLLEVGDESTIARFRDLAAELPHSMRALRQLLYESGAVEASAVQLEALRETIHRDVAAIATAAPSLRTLLDVVDGLAQSIYQVEPIPQTEALWRPAGPWHEAVRAEHDRFIARMAPLGFDEPPRLVPWHRASWMFVPERDAVFYPDVEGHADDTLPFQAMLLGHDDLGRARARMAAQLPAVLAHEMFHAWRHRADRLTRDHWHEEWAANRLAVAYCRRHCPEVLQASKRLTTEVTRHFAALVERHAGVLDRCAVAGHETEGYGMDWLAVAVVNLELVRRLIEVEEPLEAVMTELLTPARPQALTG